MVARRCPCPLPWTRAAPPAPPRCLSAHKPARPLLPAPPTALHPHPPTPPPPPPGRQALAAYHADVVGGLFPSEAYSPYKIAQHEASQLLRDLEREGLGNAAEAVVEQLEAGREAAAARAE